MAADDLPDSFTVYPLGGWDLANGPNGALIVTLHYVVAQTEPKTQAELDKSLRSLRLYIEPRRASELGSEVWKAAESLEGGSKQ